MSKNRRGGAREGAGRPPQGEIAKRAVTFRLDEQVVTKLDVLSKDSGHSKAAIVEYAVRRVKKLPESL